jgi:hypothetical protein
MNVRQMAAQHSAHLSHEDRKLFMLGFNAGRAVSVPLPGLSADNDRESYFRSLLANERPAAAAGFLEGVAATRPVAPVAKPRRSYQRAVA